MAKASILIVDNNMDFLESMQWTLEEDGYHTITASNPVDAKRLFERSHVDMVILDIRLINDQDEKDLSGLTLAKLLDPSIPKIILTGYPSYEAAREALGRQLIGEPVAVDFMAKSEGPQALLTAVHKALVLRNGLTERQSTNDHEAIPSNHDLTLDEANRCIILNEHTIALTPQEYAIMKYLFEHPNEVISRQEIIREALQESFETPILEENRLNNIISRLRQKIESDRADPQYLHTYRGHGFKLTLDKK